MQIFSQNFDTLLNQLGTPAGWVQLGAVAAGFLLAWVLARLVRGKIPGQLAPGAMKIGAGSMQRLVLPVLALIFIWLAKVAYAKWQPVPILNVAVLLIASFALIRLSLYLLRHLFSGSPLLKASERAIAYAVWGVTALYLTGLLPELNAALDEVSFAAGGKKITLLSVIHALISLLLTLFIALAVSIVIENRVMRAQSLDTGMRVFAGKLVRALAFVLAILIALPLMGIDITVLSVFGGALGVGLGLGLQKIASNYVSGFIILLDRSIRIGDMVTIDQRQGVVSQLNTRYTVVRSLDGTEAIIPNESLITGTVINHSLSDKRVLLRLPIQISYGSPPELAQDLLTKIGREHPRALKEPQAGAFVTGFGDNGFEMELCVWISDPEAGQIQLRSELFMRIWQAFNENGIQVPYPQREVRILGEGKSAP